MTNNANYFFQSDSTANIVGPILSVQFETRTKFKQGHNIVRPAIDLQLITLSMNDQKTNFPPQLLTLQMVGSDGEGDDGKSDKSDCKHRLSAGSISGIVIGVLFSIIATAVITWMMTRRSVPVKVVKVDEKVEKQDDTPADMVAMTVSTSAGGSQELNMDNGSQSTLLPGQATV